MMPGARGKGSLVLFLTVGSLLFFTGVNGGYHAQPTEDPHLTKSELDLPEAGETVHRDNPIIPNQYETNNRTVSPKSERLSEFLSTPLIWTANAGITIGVTLLQAAGTGEALEDRQHFDEFCEDVYGDDATTYTANVVGPHGGLHCSDGLGGGTRSFHYSQLPQDQYQTYLDGNTSATAVHENLQPLNAGVSGQLFGWPGLVLVGVLGLTIYQHARIPRDVAHANSLK